MSDPTGTLATPIDAVERPAHPQAACAAGGARRASARSSRVVVGLPLGLAAATPPQTREARAFADAPRATRSHVPVELYDERFTTAIAPAQRRHGAERGLARGGGAAGGLARAVTPGRLDAGDTAHLRRAATAASASAADREAARRERERRRAAREGRPLPDEPSADDAERRTIAPRSRAGAPAPTTPHVSEPRPFADDDDEEPERFADEPEARAGTGAPDAPRRTPASPPAIDEPEVESPA